MTETLLSPINALTQTPQKQKMIKISFYLKNPPGAFFHIEDVKLLFIQEKAVEVLSSSNHLTSLRLSTLSCRHRLTLPHRTYLPTCFSDSHSIIPKGKSNEKIPIFRH